MEGQNNILNSWAAAKQLDDYVVLHHFELISGANKISIDENNYHNNRMASVGFGSGWVLIQYNLILSHIQLTL